MIISTGDRIIKLDRRTYQPTKYKDEFYEVLDASPTYSQPGTEDVIQFLRVKKIQ